jgi:capsular exopolysaccharide synthesis family protein
MSHIFDALQRSEEERPGIAAPALSEATELLRRAERRASSQWESETQLDKNVPAEATDFDASLKAGPPVADSGFRGAPAVHERIAPIASNDIFSQFQTLQVTLSPHNRIVCLSDEDSSAAEAFRLLGVRLRNLRRERPLKNLLITSTVPQEGKSMTAINLACMLALTTQQKVLLMEGDLRRPSLSGRVGIGKNPGLCECLKGERTLTSCIYRLEGANFWLLPAGSAQTNAMELLQSGLLPEIMAHVAEWFDWIIIDSPPVLPLGDTSVWARLADGIILVTRQGTTEKRHLQRGIEALESKKLIGALLNCSHSSSEYDYYYRASEVRPNDGSMH